METKLYIPKPCHEDWNLMTPAERGRHCAVCNKVVKDLRGLDKLETLQVLANTKETEICGNVHPAHLDAYPGQWKITIQRIKNSLLKLFLLLGLITTNKKNIFSQLPTIGEVDTNKEQKKWVDKKYKIRVAIKDEYGDSIIFARVCIQGKNGKELNINTNMNGRAEVGLNEIHLGGNEVKITITCMGFETKIMENIYLTKETTTIETELKYKAVDLQTYEMKGEKLRVSCGGSVAGRMSFSTLGLIGIETIDSLITPPDSTDKNQPTGYAEEPLAFKAYPVPTQGLFTLECNKSNIFDVQIFDNSGKMLAAIFQIAGRKEINLSEYAAGTYYIKIMENGQVLDTKKVMVVR
jgi:hypothetical protein